MTFLEMFNDHQGVPTNKFPHHIAIYDEFFGLRRDEQITVLEIGNGQGGFLQLLKEYFPKGRIIGIDIHDISYIKNIIEDIELYVGDQGEPAFWASIGTKLGDLDIVIDDGSHKCKDQIVSFKSLYNQLNDGGIYIVEDIHTSYHEQFGGGLEKEGSFIEYAKKIIDDIHISNHFSSSTSLESNHLFALHIYPSLAIIEKRSPHLWGGSTVKGRYDLI